MIKSGESNIDVQTKDAIVTGRAERPVHINIS